MPEQPLRETTPGIQNIAEQATGDTLSGADALRNQIDASECAEDPHAMVEMLNTILEEKELQLTTELSDDRYHAHIGVLLKNSEGRTVLSYAYPKKWDQNNIRFFFEKKINHDNQKAVLPYYKKTTYQCQTIIEQVLEEEYLPFCTEFINHNTERNTYEFAITTIDNRRIGTCEFPPYWLSKSIKEAVQIEIRHIVERAKTMQGFAQSITDVVAFEA